MALTDQKIKQAKPLEKDYKLSDAKGLFLLVTKICAKYWRLKYRFLKKEKLLSLGVYPAVTLKTARKACEGTKEHLAQGIIHHKLKQLRRANRLRRIRITLKL